MEALELSTSSSMENKHSSMPTATVDCVPEKSAKVSYFLNNFSIVLIVASQVGNAMSTVDWTGPIFQHSGPKQVIILT